MKHTVLGVAVLTLIFLYECNPEQLPQLPHDIQKRLQNHLQKPPSPLDNRMSYLMSWIAARTNYKPVAVPSVKFMSPESIHNMYGKNRSRYGSVFGVYEPRTQTVVLPTSYYPPQHEALLVHELVHHLQCVHGRRFKCQDEKENEAYRIQALYARETGRGEMPVPAMMYMPCQ